MIRFNRKNALAATLLGFGFSTMSLAQSPYEPNRPIDEASKKAVVPVVEVKKEGPLSESNDRATTANTPKKNDLIVIVKEAGKADRRCVVTSEKKQPDGSVVYEVKAVDNGEVITISPAPVEKNPVLRIDILPLVKPKEPTTEAEPLIVPPAEFFQSPNAGAKLDKQLDIESPTKPNLPAQASAAEHALPDLPELPPNSLEKTEKPQRPSLWQRLFGKRQTAEPCQATCAPCRVQAPPKQEQLGATTIDLTPGHAVIESTPGRATVDLTPGRATVDLTVTKKPQRPAAPTHVEEPLSIAAGVERTREWADSEQNKVRAIKESLKAGELPTQRMAAAEEILLCVPGRVGEVRAALMQAAQEDQAPCVRAACIRALSKLGTKESAFTALLDAALDDENEDVREEANFALQKINRK